MIISVKDRFIQYIKKEKLFDLRYQILVAVSGGLDSVVLTHLLKNSGFSIVLAHVNYNLRGEESLRDKDFVLNLGKSWCLKVLVKDIDAGEYANNRGISIQVAAREIRYSWFSQLLKDDQTFFNAENQPKVLVTAHHADDNVETMLMHFFRGTGIHGLRGMLPDQYGIVRPLLPFTRKELLYYAEENNLQWVEDSSNSSQKYSRNYFRNTLVPVVKEIYPSAEHNLQQNLSRFREVELLYNEAIEIHRKKLLEYRDNDVFIPVLKLQKTIPQRTVLYELIKGYHFSTAQVDEVLMLLNSESGKFVQSKTHRIIRNRKWLVIAPVAAGESTIDLIRREESTIHFREGMLSWETIPSLSKEIKTDRNTATLDAAKIKFPLILRKWKTGDYFYPLGMQRKKKVSRFLIDNKLSGIEKNKVYVLEMDKRIIWVVGYRIDDRFKIEPSTKEIILFNYRP